LIPVRRVQGQEFVMATLVHRSAVGDWAEPQTAKRLHVKQPQAVAHTRSQSLLERIVEVLIAIPATIVSGSLQFLIYAGVVLLFPFLPFLMPIFAAPIILLLSGSVVAFGAFLTAIGWL
jgi:hypothetical protein